MIFVNYKFNGSLHHSFYYQIPQFFNSPEYFIHNFFIEKSSVIYSSIYYPTLKFLSIDIYNGLNSFLIHFLFSLISILYCYKVIRLIIKNEKISYLILLCVVCSDFFILSSIRSSPVFSHTLTPSHLSHSLLFPLIYFTQKSRWIIVSILSSISILISIKVSWFPITVTYLYYLNLIYRQKRFDLKFFKSLFWMLIPPIIAIILIFYKKSNIDFTFDEKIKIFEFILLRDDEEDALHLNSTIRIFFLFISFFVFRYINKYFLRGNLNLYNNILLVSTVVMTIGGLIYNKYLYLYFPIPELLLLSPVRSLSLYQLLFTLLIVNYSIEKSESNLYVFVLIYLSFVTISFGSFNYTLFVFFFLIGVNNLIYKLFGNKLPTNLFIGFTIIVSLFLLLIKSNFRPKNISFVGDENIFLNKRIDQDLLNASFKIQDNPDFSLLSISNKEIDDKLNVVDVFSHIDNRSNIFAMKSNYIGDSAHFYLNLSNQREYFRRLEFIKILFRYLNDPYKFEKFEKTILCEDIVILGPKKIFKNLENNFTPIDIGQNYQLLSLGVHKYYNIK